MRVVFCIIPLLFLVLSGCQDGQNVQDQGKDVVGYMVSKLADDTQMAQDEMMSALKNMNSREYHVEKVKNDYLIDSFGQPDGRLLALMNRLGKQQWLCVPTPSQYKLENGFLNVTEYTVSCSRVPESLMGSVFNLLPLFRFFI